MELIHIANATFSSSRIKINHSLENLASKTKLTGLLKSTRLNPRRRSALAPARDQASPPAGGLASSRVVASSCWMFNGGLGAGGASRDRTGDLLVANQTLSQLSYGPLPLAKIVETIFAIPYRVAAGSGRPFARYAIAGAAVVTLVGLGGVAPPTSPLSGVRSN
jgi:hypothetical protein